MTQNIAIIDKTGRGHSICQALISTNRAVTVHYIPGTAGIFDDRIIPVPKIALDDPEAIDKYCQKQGIELIAVMHIDALKADVSTALRSRGYVVFGPSSKAVQLETSKTFCKKICHAAGISTPFSRHVNSKEELLHHLPPNRAKHVMIKADWLTLNGNGAIRVPPST